VTDYTTASADGMIASNEQIRVEGGNSNLGNPVDVAFDAENNVVLVAERAVGGGRILGFNTPSADGDATPFYNKSFAGASAVYLSGAAEKITMNIQSRLFLSSNTTGLVGVLDMLEDNSFALASFTGQAMDADGIHYDDEMDVLYQLNRSANVINAYSNVSQSLSQGIMPTLTATSTSDFINGREIAVSKNRLVVAQDANDANGQMNRFLIYDISPTSITLNKIYESEINLWGIVAQDEDLYAIQDNSNNIAKYENFFAQPAGTISVTWAFPVEGLVRTHGLSYDAENDQMILTDIGDAASTDDGALVIIDNFSVSILDLQVQLSEQVRIAGPNTMLGNPVDVAIDKSLGLAFVAERANGGGRVLAFDILGSSGNDSPFYAADFAGASAIYLAGSDNFSSVVGVGESSFEINLFPNPARESVQLSFAGDVNLFKDSTLEIFDVAGKLVYSTQNVAKSNQIDVSQLSAGVYIALLSNQQYKQEIKFSKL
jgi:6-phosphogluconolactonase (cycloisomerase 2 family)